MVLIDVALDPAATAGFLETSDETLTADDGSAVLFAGRARRVVLLSFALADLATEEVFAPVLFNVDVAPFGALPEAGVLSELLDRLNRSLTLTLVASFPKLLRRFTIGFTMACFFSENSFPILETPTRPPGRVDDDGADDAPSRRVFADVDGRGIREDTGLLSGAGCLSSVLDLALKQNGRTKIRKKSMCACGELLQEVQLIFRPLLKFWYKAMIWDYWSPEKIGFY